MALVQRLRQKIIDEDYYLSGHAELEMLDDDLTIYDVENAILKGIIDRKLTFDPRGMRYRVQGPTLDNRLIHVICRIDSNDRLRLITVYALSL